MDSIRHPDLIEVTARMQAVLDAALTTEQIAAEVAYRRERNFRDVLMEFEDRGTLVRVSTPGRTTRPGPIVGVGRDHILIGDRKNPTVVQLWSIESVEPA